MMNVLNGGAHADNNVDFQEFMVMPVGRGQLLRGAALGRRDLPRAARRCCTTGACRPPSATRAASRPTWPPTRRRSQLLVEAIEQAGLHARRRDRHRPRPGRHRVLRRRRLRPRRRGPDARPRPRWPTTAPTCATATRSCRSRTAWPRTTGTAGPRSPSALGDRVQLVGDDLFVTNVERLAAGHRRRRGQLDPGQGQPDRHAHRDPRHRRPGHPQRATPR